MIGKKLLVVGMAAQASAKAARKMEAWRQRGGDAEYFQIQPLTTGVSPIGHLVVMDELASWDDIVLPDPFGP